MRQISRDWWIGLDDTYHGKVDDGSLVFWKAERTLWINIWDDAGQGTPEERLASWTVDRSPDARDLFRQDEDGLLRFGYLLEEPSEGGGTSPGVYSFTVSPSSTVQMACYFELKEDLDWALAVSRSLTFGSTAPERFVLEPVGDYGHFAVISHPTLGSADNPILVAVREDVVDSQDSGWRLFSPNEPNAAGDGPRDPALTTLSTLLDLDPSLRAILNSPPGSRWRRETPDSPWEPIDRDAS
ncbi:MAG: DUF2185 domain-containing protein [Isosphaeraceae bacterium]